VESEKVKRSSAGDSKKKIQFKPYRTAQKKSSKSMMNKLNSLGDNTLPWEIHGKWFRQ
jgi:hypothetical protein